LSARLSGLSAAAIYSYESINQSAAAIWWSNHLTFGAGRDKPGGTRPNHHRPVTPGPPFPAAQDVRRLRFGPAAVPAFHHRVITPLQSRGPPHSDSQRRRIPAHVDGAVERRQPADDIRQ
jgi:hypothetical protein